MKSWPPKGLVLAGAAALALAIPASGQESEAPESLLPPTDLDTITNEIERTLREETPLRRGDRVVVAVSGMLANAPKERARPPARAASWLRFMEYPSGWIR
mgnify:CR=1 FL=1